MLSERVAQKPTMPVRLGTKKAQKAAEPAKPEGLDSRGTRPPWTWEMAQYNNASAASGRKKALKTSSFRMLSTPSHTTYILMSQKRKKQSAGPVSRPQKAGN